MDPWALLFFIASATAFFLEKRLMETGRRKEGFLLLGAIFLLLSAPLAFGAVFGGTFGKPGISVGQFLLSFVIALGPGFFGLAGALMGLHPGHAKPARNYAERGQR